MKMKRVMAWIAAVALLVAPVAMAQPVDGFGWLGWIGSVWSSALEVVGVSAASSEEPEPVPPAKAPEDDGATTTDCEACGGGGGEVGPLIDPDG